MQPSFEIAHLRQPAHEVLPVIVNRWSPRAMSGAPLSASEIARLFEAARWAPSANNNQPWRFLYARRGSADWQAYFDLLADGNQRWCTQAALLVIIVSKTVNDYNGKAIRTHGFDSGAAWALLALQGASMGLVVHGMAGFDYDRARSVLGLPAEYAVQAMAAVGRPGDISALPADLAEREVPSARKPLAEIAWEGGFPPAG